MRTQGGRSAYETARARKLWELNQRYEQYDGELGWNAWLAEQRRDAQLNRLGIEAPSIPDVYANALGPQRTERLERLVEDRLVDLTVAPEEPRRLEGEANRLQSSGAALDLALSNRVTRLERQTAYLDDRLREATERADGASDTAEVVSGPKRQEFLAEAKREGAREENLREMLRSVRTKRDALSREPGNPEAWLDGPEGQRFAAALAASSKLGREPTLAPEVPGTGGPEARVVEQQPATPEAGLDFS